jgi:hypothetical protein
MKKGLAVTLAAGAMALVVVGFGMSNRAQAKFTCATSDDGWPVIAQPFDTIWQIASDNCEGNLQNAVHHMIQLNDGSAILQIGQTVQIPESN